MLALWVVLVLSLLGGAKGQCDFFTDNCVFPDETGLGMGGLGTDVFCYLAGEPGEPRVDEVLAQKYDTPAHAGCPKMSTRGVRFVLFL